MAGQISPKLRKVIELWRRTDKDGERQAARARGEAMAKAVGMTFEEAVRAATKPTPQPNPFAGFDDWMEAKQPGYKTQRAQERAAKAAAQAKRRAAIIAKHGSEAAALAPCWREALILAAVKPWRAACNPPNERWTYSLDGWRDYFTEPPPHIRDAIAGAYPLPRTIAAAKLEHDYWEARAQELRDVAGDLLGDVALDLAAETRAEMVRKLFERTIPARDIGDVFIRFAHYRVQESHSDKIEERLFADVAGLATCATVARTSPDLSSEQMRVRRPVSDDAIRETLRADPSKSDRSIARTFGVSPSTVGKHRRAAGLVGAVRTIRRGSQSFEARYGRA